MPTTIREMLTASETHDAALWRSMRTSDEGIEHRDLPQSEPRYHELKEITASIMARIKSPLETGERNTLRHEIMSALIEVREAATSAAACRAWNRAVELLK